MRITVVMQLKGNCTSFCSCSEYCGDIDSLELGDTVEYSLSKGKGNKVSAEKVNKTHAGKTVLHIFCLQGSWQVLTDEVC